MKALFLPEVRVYFREPIEILYKKIFWVRRHGNSVRRRSIYIKPII